ncbi:MAG: hypothetical protein ACM3ON_09545, partial [Chloroflexota bacterium]
LSAGASICLPKEHSAYIDFARISPYDFTAKKFSTPRYYAFVLLSGSTLDVKLIDLGEAEKLDKQVTAYLRAIEDFGQYVDKVGEVDTPKLRTIVSRQEEAARELYALVLKPLVASLKGVKQLFLSPDGNLNLLPFPSRSSSPLKGNRSLTSISSATWGQAGTSCGFRIRQLPRGPRC